MSYSDNLSEDQIKNELLSIEALAQSLMQRATTLRKQLEGATPPAPRRGLSDDDKKRLSAKLSRTVHNQKKVA